jgi:hypothetical protein
MSDDLKVCRNAVGGRIAHVRFCVSLFHLLNGRLTSVFFFVSVFYIFWDKPSRTVGIGHSRRPCTHQREKANILGTVMIPPNMTYMS